MKPFNFELDANTLISIKKFTESFDTAMNDLKNTQGKYGIMPMPWQGKSMSMSIRSDIEKAAAIMQKASPGLREFDAYRAAGQLADLGHMRTALQRLDSMPLPISFVIRAKAQDTESFYTRLKTVRDLTAIRAAQRNISKINFAN